MEQAFGVLTQHGLAGAIIILCVLAIVALSNRLNGVSEKRLTENRETLLTIAEVNRTLSSLKDAVAGLSTSLSALTSTVQTMQADSRAALGQTQQVRDRIERQIDQNGEHLRAIRSAVEDTAKDVDRLQAGIAAGR